jgi:tripartite ATP-independent transporter DctM subunit
MPPGSGVLEAAAAEPGEQPSGGGWTVSLENGFSVAVLTLLTLAPLAEFFTRGLFHLGLPGSIPLSQHLTLWITLTGAALAAREGRLLALASTELFPKRVMKWTRLGTNSLAAAVSTLLAVACIALISVERDAGSRVALGIPVWLAVSIMPVAFALIALRLALRASDAWWGRLFAALGIVAVLVINVPTDLQGQGLLLPAFGVVVLATMLGMPIFAGVGALALCFVWDSGFPLASVPSEAYRLTASPMLPAVPLFTLGGYVLAESGSSQRLFRLLSAFFGWMPGGMAVVTILILAAFTPLTGASGVTILSLGGLLLPGLLKVGYPERFSLGLVTAAGSIGLLLPPSLPVILYGVAAHVSILELFVGGLVPGVLLIVLIALWGVRAGVLASTTRDAFSAREAMAAIWESKWELALPVVVLGSYFGGAATLVEAAALMVLGALFIACVVHRDLSVVRDLPRLAVESATLVGGFLIILCMALALTNYFVLDEIPMRALEVVQQNISSPLVFLAALNVLLIIVGGLMDIYSAIFVVVPLITPMAAAYGINPVHLGIIFLANLELGYLTPPMGENLFLSAYRFKQSLPTLFRSTLAFWVLLLVGVLLITYVPFLTLGPVAWYTD